MQLFQSDLDLMLDAIIFGASPIPGTDPFTQEGIRNVDGTFNNLLHIFPFPDQYLDQTTLDPFDIHMVNTDDYGVTDQPFIYFTPRGGPDGVYYDGPGPDSSDGPIVTAAVFEAAYEAATGLVLDWSAAPFFTGMVDDFGDDYAPLENVIDTSPRIISNLVVDMSIAPPEATGNPGDPAIFVTPFNSLFTFFGQFFDHGLDFINKGGSGIILVPILLMVPS